MPDGGTYVWLLISACAFVLGFFVGMRHGKRVVVAANTAKDAAKDVAGKV